MMIHICFRVVRLTALVTVMDLTYTTMLFSSVIKTISKTVKVHYKPWRYTM